MHIESVGPMLRNRESRKGWLTNTAGEEAWFQVSHDVPQEVGWMDCEKVNR